MRPLQRVLEACLYVDDLEVNERFYREVLGLSLMTRRAGVHSFFKLDGGMVLLFQPDSSGTPREIPSHGTEGPGHLCFAVNNDELPAWRSHLEAHGVEIEHEHLWPTGGHSIYFRDPAGNSLEFASPRIWLYDED